MYEKDPLKTTLELIMISSNFHDFDQLVPNCRKYHFLTANVQANWSPNGAGYFLEISVACMAWLGLPLAWHGLGLVWAWPGQCQPKIPNPKIPDPNPNPKIPNPKIPDPNPNPKIPKP